MWILLVKKLESMLFCVHENIISGDNYPTVPLVTDNMYILLICFVVPVVPTECDVLIVCRQHNDKEWQFKEQHAKMRENIAGAKRYSRRVSLKDDGPTGQTTGQRGSDPSAYRVSKR